MAWLIPQSTTNLGGVAVNLGAADSVFIAAGVTIASTASTAIIGSGSNHQALIYGTVAGTDNYTLALGSNGSVHSGQVVTVKAGGHVQGFGGVSAIGIFAFASRVTNEGLISSPNGNGIFMQGSSPSTTSAIVNSGTIEVGNYGINSSGTEAHVLTNSGLISGSAGSYFGADSRDRIANTGRMVGDILLRGGDDVYNGASGRLTGTVFGGDGNDTITGGLDNDRFEGGANNDTLRGGGGNDRLFGDGGNDTLDGGTGADTMTGGTGADTYHVDNAGDIVDETGGSGTDTVQSTISFSLANTARVKGAVENLTLIGNAAINATGNALKNTITGNAKANVLDGGAGADELRGGAGNDTYVLGAEASGVDKVIDSAGINTVTSTVTRSLAHAQFSEIENLTLLGRSAINATGNTLANVIVGNSKANRIEGGGGQDDMTGGGGNDVFVFRRGSDSGLGKKADLIRDFDASGDDGIDFSAFSGKYTYVHDAAFTGARQVRILDVSGPDVVVQVNTGGSLAADIEIRLTGMTLAAMGADDFVL